MQFGMFVGMFSNWDIHGVLYYLIVHWSYHKILQLSLTNHQKTKAILTFQHLLIVKNYILTFIATKESIIY